MFSSILVLLCFPRGEEEALQHPHPSRATATLQRLLLPNSLKVGFALQMLLTELKDSGCCFRVSAASLQNPAGGIAPLKCATPEGRNGCLHELFIYSLAVSLQSLFKLHL